MRAPFSNFHSVADRHVISGFDQRLARFFNILFLDLSDSELKAWEN